MKKQNLLPILRKWKTWTALAAAVILLVTSTAWMDKVAADSQAEIDRVYDEMEVHFVLNAGRRNLSTGISIPFSALRQMLKGDYFENMDLIEQSAYINFNDEGVSVWWTTNPDASGIRVLEGSLEGGLWLAESLAEKWGVSAGGSVTASFTGTGKRAETVTYVYPVAAVISGNRTYADANTFAGLAAWNYGNSAIKFSMADLHFDLKKEYNPDMYRIEQKLQSELNTPRQADRNRDISVNYNASEIDGMLRPLQSSASSAEFFGKLFRGVLPLVAYVIGIIGMLGLVNEIGVRRFLGEGRGKVFLGVWLPVLALCLPGYLLCAAVMPFTPFGPYVPWKMMGLHLAGLALLTALLTGILCLLKPLDLLKEKEYE